MVETNKYKLSDTEFLDKVNKKLPIRISTSTWFGGLVSESDVRSGVVEAKICS